MTRSIEAVAKAEIFTVGHGNRPLEELTQLLASAQIGCLVDVRAFPGSRRHPHFNRGELEHSLPSHEIEYHWAGTSLGGRRKPRSDSVHVALRNASFRAYADHMESAEFVEAITALRERASRMPVAIMCAERLPWQCHRYMISDYLVAHGAPVRHLLDLNPPREHHLRAEARIANGRLIYDGQLQADLRLD